MVQPYEINRYALEKAINQRHLRACQVADQIGISRNTMSRTLNGHTIPSLEVVHLLSNFLKLTDREIIRIFHSKNKGV